MRRDVPSQALIRRDARWSVGRHVGARVGPSRGRSQPRGRSGARSPRHRVRAKAAAPPPRESSHDRQAHRCSGARRGHDRGSTGVSPMPAACGSRLVRARTAATTQSLISARRGWWPPAPWKEPRRQEAGQALPGSPALVDVRLRLDSGSRDAAVAALRAKELTMSARRIAVLVGSHDPAYFAPSTPPDRPSEPAVLIALRAQRSTSEAGHRESAVQTPTDDGRSVARHARAGAGARRTHVPDSAGPLHIRAFAATRTRRATRHRRAPVLASRTAGA
jgi:hypothetical protein